MKSSRVARKGKGAEKFPTQAQRMNGGFVPALRLTMASEVAVFVVVGGRGRIKFVWYSYRRPTAI